MDTYTPINKAILTSTIWGEKHYVRILWITMMISADRYGRVAGSVPGLARIAAITVEECNDALRVLQSPDPYSRTPDHEGRRIRAIDGGWELLNYQKHKDILDRGAQRSRERVRRHREALRNVSVTQCNDQNQNQNQNTKPKDQPPIPPEGDPESVVVRVESDQRVSCPADLRLTEDQRGALETSLVPGWAIDEITKSFVASAIADQTDKRQLIHWQKCLAKAVASSWNDKKRRPKKPETETLIDQNGKPARKPRPGEVWHKDGYWFFPIGVDPT